MQKVKHFFKNNLTIVLSGIIVLCLVLFLFAINSSWPFGNKSCAMYDLSAQIVQQINLVRDIFEGKGTLFYSHRLGGGMSIFATLIYFVFSPFYIVLLIGGRSNTILTVNLVLLLYLMAVAISMAFCLKKLFPLVSNFFQIVLSLCYTFGAFILLNYSFIIWLNFMILLPIIFIAFKRMLTEKKYLLFSFLTFVFIISCYALGSTSQFLLLAIYYLYILICVDKSHRREHLVRLTVAMFIAIMLSSIILVPCYLESTATVRTGYQFNMFLDKNLATETNVRYVYYIIDFAISVLGILFIAFSNKKDKTNRFLSIVMAGLVIFSLIDISIMIVNFGLYASYSSRMCYIYSCLSIFACAKLLTDYKLKNVTETESLKQSNQQLTETNVNKKTKKLNFIMPIVWAVSLICLVAVVCNYFTSIKYIFYKFVINKVENLTIKLYFVIAICFVLQFIIAIILFKVKKISLKMIKISLSVMLIGQVIVNSSFVYFSAYNQDVYTSNAQIMKNVDDYDMVRQNIVNANLSYDTSSFAVFTSMLPEKNAKVMNNLGIENKMNSINITGGTLFSHSFLGLDYILFKGARNYPIFEYVDNIEFTDIDETNRNLHLYKYKYSTKPILISGCSLKLKIK